MIVKYRPVLSIVFIFFISNFIHAQIGGDNDYEVLNLSPSARMAAMGGNFLTINDNDITLIQANPSLLNPGLHNHLGVAFVDYYTGINYGASSYSRTFENLGSFAASIKYVDYGKFVGADETGTKTGDFYGGQSCFDLGWGRQLDSLFSIGANLKMIYSSQESYNSFGMAVDVAGSYFSRDRSLTISLIAKNIGRQLASNYDNNHEPLPFEIQIGLSKRLAHLPFTYSILYNHLEKWDLMYDDPADVKTDAITGEVQERPDVEVFFDNLARHIVIGGELYIGKYISLRGGYNYQRRQELKIESKPATVGFSWGVGLRISKFQFSYARSTYHLAGSPNYITIATNLSDFFIRKN